MRCVSSTQIDAIEILRFDNSILEDTLKIINHNDFLSTNLEFDDSYAEDEEDKSDENEESAV